MTHKKLQPTDIGATNILERYMTHKKLQPTDTGATSI